MLCGYDLCSASLDGETDVVTICQTHISAALFFDRTAVLNKTETEAKHVTPRVFTWDHSSLSVRWCDQ